MFYGQLDHNNVIKPKVDPVSRKGSNAIYMGTISLLSRSRPLSNLCGKENETLDASE